MRRLHDARYIAAVVAVMIGVGICGCRNVVTKKEQVTPPPPQVVAVPEFAKPAVEAMGGLNAWSRTEAITGECTVTVFGDDGKSTYFTEQKHAVYPWSDTIRVVAAEPQGRFVWQLFRDEFTLLNGNSWQAQRLPTVIFSKYTTEAIWAILAPPSRIATIAMPAVSTGQAMRLDGVWHFSIKLQGDRVYYQNRATNVVDATLIPVSDNKYLLARGFNYRPVANTMILLPAKIEIFEASAEGAPQRRLMEINYTTLRSISF